MQRVVKEIVGTNESCLYNKKFSNEKRDHVKQEAHGKGPNILIMVVRSRTGVKEIAGTKENCLRNVSLHSATT